MKWISVFVIIFCLGVAVEARDVITLQNGWKFARGKQESSLHHYLECRQ